MRHIKFRGRRYDNSEWIYGTYWEQPLRYGHHSKIYVPCVDEETKAEGWVHVDRESIGQFIGLKDNNEKEIYEGDIIQRSFDDYKEPCIVIYDGALCCVHPIGIPDRLRPMNTKEHNGGCNWCKIDDEYSRYKFRVIGNIHDNKDMLK